MNKKIKSLLVIHRDVDDCKIITHGCERTSFYVGVLSQLIFQVQTKIQEGSHSIESNNTLAHTEKPFQRNSRKMSSVG